MPPYHVHGFRAICVALGLLGAALSAAETKEARPSSPIGLTRDEVIARYGEPKSQMLAGNRVIMFFARERLVLRDGVVVEAEKLAAEPRRTSPPVAAPAPASAPSTPAPATDTAPAATPAPPAERTGAAGAVPATATPPPPSTPASKPIEVLDPAAEPPAQLEIKSVRGPGTRRVPARVEDRPAVTATPPAPSTPTTPAATPPVATNGPTTEEPSKTTPPPATVKMPEAQPIMPVSPVARAEEEPKEEPVEKKEDAELAAKKAKDKKIQAVRARRRIAEAGDPDAPELAEAFLTTRTLIMAFVLVGAGVGYLLWRHRQRQLLLTATAVSNSPFSFAGTAATGGTTFTPQLLEKLEWKRFEELVANYYTKTGVVAVRTKAGPSTPVHIKISWKGEPRPFACVQCIAHPAGLIDAQPLQELVNVLTAEDIRRGYVVTTGKFGVSARDYAEEKHLTLLPGDIFLEKLNALPETARAEIMQAVATGDYHTPSCPKCDAKMVKSEDGTQWRCPNHAEQVIPVWR